MLFYRAALPLFSKTLNCVAGIIRRRRATIGSAWRKVNPGRAGDWVRGRHVLAELEAAGLVTLADKGYLASTHAKIPYRGRKNGIAERGEPRSCEAPHARRKGECPAQELADTPQASLLPWRAGQLAKAIHALVIHAA